jgi:hypothetical protein
MKPNGSEESEEKSLTVAGGSLAELAPQLEHGAQIIEARAKILETARRAAIAMTNPEDWVRHLDQRTGIETAYLQDVGCQRVRPIFGIDTLDVTVPEKIMLQDGSQHFMYIVRGSGFCSLTQERIENVEGGRSSNDDFIVKQDPAPQGAQLELIVRKAARANLDGTITRKLAGLGSVPFVEIEQVFSSDQGKTENRFRKGRGFGSQRHRQSQEALDQSGAVVAPVCPQHGVKMIFRAGTDKYEAFWGCPRYKSDNCKETVADAKWRQAKQSDGAKAGIIGASLAADLERLAGRTGWKPPELMAHVKAKYDIEALAQLPRDAFEDLKSLIEGGNIHER